MLGKLIKNEFVNRWKPVVAVLVGMLAFSLVECLLTVLDFDSRSYVILKGTTTVLYYIAYTVSLVAILAIPLHDFQNRFFKDQGYLTHTLPVKTSTMIIARMICDIVTVISVIIMYPLYACIIERNFEFYKDCTKWINEQFFGYGRVDDKVLSVIVFILIIIAFFLGILFIMWQFNAAYAVGHTFSNSKKIMSVVCYILTFIIFEVILYFLSVVIKLPDLEGIAGACVFMLIVDIAELIGVLILAAITNFICKYHLNLE